MSTTRSGPAASPRTGAPDPLTGAAAPSGDAAAEQLAAIVRCSQDAIIGESLDGAIVSWNPAAERLYGWTAAEAIGKATELLVPLGEQLLEAQLLARTTGGEVLTAREVRRLHKSGAMLEVSLSMSPVIDGAGRTVGISSSSRDLGPGRRTEARLAAIVQSSQDAVIGKSRTGEIMDWNPAAERLYGWTAAEAVGHGIDLLVPATERAHERRLLQRTVAGEQLQPIEVPRLHRDGSIRLVSLTMSPIFDGNGEIVGVASLSRDISDLSRARARFQRILDGAPDAMVCFDRDGLISFVNAQVETLFQYPVVGLLGQPVEILLPELNRPDHAEHRAQYLQDPTPRLMGAGRPLFGCRRDGSTFPADVSLAPVGESGEQLTVAAVRDATERYAIEASLRESEDRYRQVTDNIRVGFTLRNVGAHELLYASAGFQHVFGLDPLAPATTLDLLRDCIHPDDRGENIRSYIESVDRGQAVEAELRIVRPDGQTRWLRVTNSPVLGPDGALARLAGTFEDITERKIAESAARSARQEAERANSAKNEFLSRMSHELRTPLNAVLGFAQLLELDPLTEPQNDAVHHILRGGRHLLEMINDVLDISRIDNDALEISVEAVFVSELLADCVGLMRPTATDAGVQIDYDTGQPGGAHYVQADRRRLRQVVLNLLSNAIKYNKRAGRVRLECSAAPDAWLRIAVIDSGIGIKLEDLPRLFVPFDRLGEASSEIEGTGIGLALSQRLVAVMGGELEVHSTVGSGSTFTVVLPIVETGVLAAGAVELANSAVTQVQESTLLYIEDNISNVQLVERIVQRRPGWNLIHAGTGALGLVLAASNTPALILLDMHLPDMTGIDVLWALWADPATTTPSPVVVVSADASPQQIARAQAAGAIRYLTKPLGVGELLAVLDEHSVRVEGTS